MDGQLENAVPGSCAHPACSQPRARVQAKLHVLAQLVELGFLCLVMAVTGGRAAIDSAFLVIGKASVGKVINLQCGRHCQFARLLILYMRCFFACLFCIVCRCGQTQCCTGNGSLYTGGIGCAMRR